MDLKNRESLDVIYGELDSIIRELEPDRLRALHQYATYLKDDGLSLQAIADVIAGKETIFVELVGEHSSSSE